MIKFGINWAPAFSWEGVAVAAKTVTEALRGSGARTVRRETVRLGRQGVISSPETGVGGEKELCPGELGGAELRKKGVSTTRWATWTRGTEAGGGSE